MKTSSQRSDLFIAEERLIAVVSSRSRPSDKGGGEGGGGEFGHPDPEIRGVGRSPKRFVSALRASFWSKNKRGPRAPPLDPPLVVKQNDVF